MDVGLFVILQKYDFSSKSQLTLSWSFLWLCCLWYCKSTIFQANHNGRQARARWFAVVCDTAKVRFFKQITTFSPMPLLCVGLFVILQKYDFSSKSQLKRRYDVLRGCCLWYCKSTIFQANHNYPIPIIGIIAVVCDTAKVRFFKQITTCYLSE